MKQDCTHITVILDRTGSMEPIRDDTIGGFNTFLKQQQEAPGSATLTLVQFDTEDPYEVIHHFKPIEKVPRLSHETYVPRASTPLLDAMGRGINDLEKCLGELKKKDRPAKVIFAVVTDGQENSSREFTRDQVTKMVKEKTEKEDWQFVFLSADLTAIDEARDVGFAKHSSRSFSKDAKGVDDVWLSMSESTAKYRACCAPAAKFEFSDEEQEPAKDSDT